MFGYCLTKFLNAFSQYLGRASSSGHYYKLFSALVLLRIMKGDSFASIIKNNHGLTTGKVQELQAEAVRFCSMVISFCEHLNWDDIAAYIAGYKDRILAGCADSRCKSLMMEVPGMTIKLASRLVEKGYLTVRDLKDATVEELVYDLSSQGAFIPKNEEQNVKNHVEVKKLVSGIKRSAAMAFDEL